MDKFMTWLLYAAAMTSMGFVFGMFIGYLINKYRDYVWRNFDFNMLDIPELPEGRNKYVIKRKVEELHDGKYKIVLSSGSCFWIRVVKYKTPKQLLNNWDKDWEKMEHSFVIQNEPDLQVLITGPTIADGLEARLAKIEKDLYGE